MTDSHGRAIDYLVCGRTFEQCGRHGPSVCGRVTRGVFPAESVSVEICHECRWRMDVADNGVMSASTPGYDFARQEIHRA